MGGEIEFRIITKSLLSCDVEYMPFKGTQKKKIVLKFKLSEPRTDTLLREKSISVF